jgi:hypothetical protein
MSSCPADSDANIKDGTDPASPDYIGKHAGTAFMEMQFYPPGWVPWPAGVSCDATQWCAALNIDSLNQDGNTGTVNNPNCLNRVGIEPISFAFITKSGVPHSAPDPLSVFSPPYPSLTPNPATDLFMNSGDNLTVDLHDTPAGFQVAINDQSTGQSGSMTASVANGWQQIKYEPTSATCHEQPYAYHPMYGSSSEHTRVPWAAHTYNVAFSDEIGHFEYCNASDEDGNCIDPGSQDGTLDDDDGGCFNADDSLLVAIGGCLGTDIDFDRNRAVLAGISRRVVEHVGERLGEPRLVGIDPYWALERLEMEVLSAALDQRALALQRGLDRSCEIDALGLQRYLAAQEPIRLHDRVQRASHGGDLTLDDGEDRRQFRIGASAQPDQMHRIDNGRDGIAQLMSQCAQEIAAGGHGSHR